MCELKAPIHSIIPLEDFNLVDSSLKDVFITFINLAGDYDLVENCGWYRVLLKVLICPPVAPLFPGLN